jgi:GNAT superfamily N-acetyltransferase
MLLERDLEETVVSAWPAAESLELDGWLLRASGGPTHRGNSVATLAAGSAVSLADRIARAEAWYQQRGKPPMLQLGPCSAPAGLDAALDARGYVKEGEAVTALAPSAAVAAASGSGLHAVVEKAPTQAWLSIAAGASRFAATPDVFFGFLARLEGRCRFVTAYVDGAAAATCLGIVSGARLGIYAMFTLPAHRRRGAARATLLAAATHALAQGQTELYLLVEPGNVAARALYSECGFRDVYAYHYRVKPAA